MKTIDFIDLINQNKIGAYISNVQRPTDPKQPAQDIGRSLSAIIYFGRQSNRLKYAAQSVAEYLEKYGLNVVVIKHEALKIINIPQYPRTRA